MPPVPDQLELALTRWPLRAALELGALPTAPGCARAWTRQLARECRLGRLADSAELIVSELVTNAVLASRRLDRPVIWLSLACDGEQLVILVRDFGPGAPAPRYASDDESGRGLMLVEAISDRFGWCRSADDIPGKVVWAVLQCELPPLLRPGLRVLVQGREGGCTKLTGAAGAGNSDAAVAAEFVAAEAAGDDDGDHDGAGEQLTWYVDSAYGTGELRAAGYQAVIKPWPLLPAVEGGFTADNFTAGCCRRDRYLPAVPAVHHLQ